MCGGCCICLSDQGFIPEDFEDEYDYPEVDGLDDREDFDEFDDDDQMYRKHTLYHRENK
jgi:hypothetical protein